MNELERKRRQLIAIYLLWVFINIVTWVASDGGDSTVLWPFSEGYNIMEIYDFSEFLIYTIGPVVLLVVYSIYTGKGAN